MGKAKEKLKCRQKYYDKEKYLNININDNTPFSFTNKYYIKYKKFYDVN
jgi:hypothetical protein